MLKTPLIDALTLKQQLDQPDAPLVLDASFDLNDPKAGRNAFEQGHVPGAVYVDLDRDLCSEKNGLNGRHPLPNEMEWKKTIRRWGIHADRNVVVMDRSHAMFAARLWWMLLWAGYSKVRVLDGGWKAWLEVGGAVERGSSANLGASVVPEEQDQLSMELSKIVPLALKVHADEVQAGLGKQVLIDARSPERFRGDVEPLDAVAGHIPGATNVPFALNLDTSGKFKQPEVLREHWQAVLPSAPEQAIHQCGSGVTACHNLLATVVAGYPLGKLYAGSWSEWSAQGRPVEKG